MLKITLAFLKDDGIDKCAIFGSIFFFMEQTLNSNFSDNF